MMLVAYLLHAANRTIKSRSEMYHDAFYRVKDVILSRYGTWDGYDVQHIKGKKCNSCGGRGQHPKYSYTGKIYDWADCYRCWGGWYRFPKWICLRRIKFGPFTFHKPLKREECVGNPFTKEKLGWEVSERPVIEGYIEHDDHHLGVLAIYLLFMIYDRDTAKVFINRELYWRKVRVKNRISNAYRRLKTFRHKEVGTALRYEHDEDLPF